MERVAAGFDGLRMLGHEGLEDGIDFRAGLLRCNAWFQPGDTFEPWRAWILHHRWQGCDGNYEIVRVSGEESIETAWRDSDNGECPIYRLLVVADSHDEG